MLFPLTLVAFTSAESKEQVPAIARRMLSDRNVIGDLATVTAERYPYVSLQSVWESCDSPGDPVVALVSWGTHGKNLGRNKRASIQIREPYFFNNATGQPEILNHSRYTLFGRLVQSKNKFEDDLECCLRSHPNARGWIRSHDFRFYSMHVEKLNWIGGYGTEHYVGTITGKEWYSHFTLNLQ